jgi:hypothetical protein
MGAAGSAAAPVITRTGDTNTGIFFPAADTIAFAEGGVEAARFDASGNFGLGVTPSAWSIGKNIDFGPTGAVDSDGYTRLLDNVYYNAAWKTKVTGQSSYYQMGVGVHSWFTAPSVTAGSTPTFTQAMTLDASGNLGIGTTSPATRLQIKQSTETNGVSLIDTYTSNEWTTNHNGSNAYTWRYNGTERARIDSSGNLLVGSTSTNPTNGFVANTNSGSGFYTQTGHPNGTGSGVAYSRFMYNQTEIGSITQNGTTGVLYNLTSDYRLKNEQQPLTGAKEFVMALQPKKWQWWDGSGEGVGFIAHEFMEVAKYSGRGDKDAVDENGNPVYQSIQPSSSEVMANLVAHIQNLETRLAALENQ